MNPQTWLESLLRAISVMREIPADRWAEAQYQGLKDLEEAAWDLLDDLQSNEQ